MGGRSQRCDQAPCERAGSTPESEERGSQPGSRSPWSKFLLVALAVSLSHSLSKSCFPTGYKSVSLILKNKTKQHSQAHTYGQYKGQGNPCLSILLVLWPLWNYNSLSTSFLLCKTEMTVCLDLKITRTKWNNVCESTLYTIKHGYCYITGT